MAKRSRPRIVMDQLDLEAFPEHVQVALAEVVGAAREGVLALSVACGLQVVTELMAADLERICGPKGKHDAGREAYRHGSERRLLPLGGALVGADVRGPGPPRAARSPCPPGRCSAPGTCFTRSPSAACWPACPPAATGRAQSRGVRSSFGAPHALRSLGAFAGQPRQSSPSCSAGTSRAWTCWRCSSTACTSEAT